jgi:predicted nucleic acid-binding protein
MFLLDTNVVSELMKPEPNGAVLEWVDCQPPSDLFASTITRAEIELGIALLPPGRRRDALAEASRLMFQDDLAGALLAFDEGAAIRYGALVAHRTRLGRPISVEDAQIAATALHHGLTLVTRNVRDFEAIDGLGLMDPWCAA